MDFQRQTRPGRPPLSQINVTPLVDVMLVLLIIFMVTASLGQQGITINLPKAKATPLSITDDRITVSIDDQKHIFINTDRVERSDLTRRLESLFSTRKDKTIFLKSDKTVPYGDFVQIVSLIKGAGIQQLGMITDTPSAP